MQDEYLFVGVFSLLFFKKAEKERKTLEAPAGLPYFPAWVSQ